MRLLTHQMWKPMPPGPMTPEALEFLKGWILAHRHNKRRFPATPAVIYL